MTLQKMAILVVFLVTLILVFFYGKNFWESKIISPTNNQAANPSPKVKRSVGEAKIVGWTAYWDEKNTYDSLIKSVNYLDSFSPILYRIEKDGSLGRLNVLNRKEVLALARQKGIPIIPVLGDDFDFARVSLILRSEEAGKKFINQLVSEAQKEGFDGWDIDIESLREKDQEAFSRFIKNAAETLHKDNLKLNVVVFARVGNDDNPAAKAQDYQELGKAADEVRIMMYGASDEDTKPGGQAPIGWVRQVMEYTISRIPREKIVVGLSTHGYDWQEEGAQPLTYLQIEKRIGEATSSVTFDNEVSSAVFKYKRDNQDHVIWFENSRAIMEKMNLILNDFGVDKIALWRVGAEDPQIWAFLENNK